MHSREVPLDYRCTRSLTELSRVAEAIDWCPSCAREVHDLGALGPDRARALVAEHRGSSICVRYQVDPSGRLRFAPTLAATRLTRRPRVRAFALAGVVSLVLSGCAKDASSPPILAPGDAWSSVEPSVEPEPEILVGVVVITRDLDAPLIEPLDDAIIPAAIRAGR